MLMPAIEVKKKAVFAKRKNTWRSGVFFRVWPVEITPQR